MNIYEYEYMHVVIKFTFKFNLNGSCVLGNLKWHRCLRS